MKAHKIALIKKVLNIIFGILVIVIGVVFPGKWLFTDHTKIYEKIDLSQFPGEIYQFNKNKIFLITIENPGGFQTAVKSDNKENILIYNNDINQEISIEIYTPINLTENKFLHTKKVYGDMDADQYKMDFKNKIITVYSSPSVCWYALYSLLTAICIVLGIIKIGKNIKKEQYYKITYTL